MIGGKEPVGSGDTASQDRVQTNESGHIGPTAIDDSESTAAQKQDGWIIDGEILSHDS